VRSPAHPGCKRREAAREPQASEVEKVALGPRKDSQVESRVGLLIQISQLVDPNAQR
jgi:hypothetical protein